MILQTCKTGRGYFGLQIWEVSLKQAGSNIWRKYLGCNPSVQFAGGAEEETAA